MMVTKVISTGWRGCAYVVAGVAMCSSRCDRIGARSRVYLALSAVLAAQLAPHPAAALRAADPRIRRRSCAHAGHGPGPALHSFLTGGRVLRSQRMPHYRRLLE